MNSRLYRHRPPKDGGTLPWYTAPNIIRSSFPQSRPSTNSNYYSIILPATQHRHEHNLQFNKQRSTNGPQPRPAHHRHKNKHLSHSSRVQDDDFTLILRRKHIRSKNSRPRHSKKSPQPHTRITKTKQGHPNYKNTPKIPTIVPLNSNACNRFIREYQSSLFTSRTISNQKSPSTMSNPATTPNKLPNSATPDDKHNLAQPLIIDPSVDDTVIKSIPLSDTWKTFTFNSSTIITESQWNELPDDDKYDYLIKLKMTPIYDITSPSTANIITADTADDVIMGMPIQDSRYLLQAYAAHQGFPHCDDNISKLTIDALHDELLKAKSKISARPQDPPIHNKKKHRHLTLPFVITHTTTDEEILQASETMIQTELQSMYTDRNLFESVLWDSLTIEDLRDMAKIERNEMLTCFSPTDEDKDHDITSPTDKADANTKIDDPEVIDILEGDSDVEDEEDNEDDMSIDQENEADKFVKDAIDEKNSDRKTFKFKFTHNILI